MDLNCDKCTFRVSEGEQGKAFMEKHQKTQHPVTRRLSDQEPPVVKPATTGQAKPESTDATGFGASIKRKYGSK